MKRNNLDKDDKNTSKKTKVSEERQDNDNTNMEVEDLECASSQDDSSKQDTNKSAAINGNSNSDNLENSTRNVPFLSIDIIVYKILPILEIKDVYRFGGTCRSLRNLSQDEKATRLLQAVADGNEDLTRTMLSFQPELLNRPGRQATTPCGKVFKMITPIKAAILEDDTDMLKMMSEIEGGKNFIETSLQECFPNGIEAHREAQEKDAFDFSEIMQAIIEAPIEDVKKALEKKFDNNLKLHNALDKFREQFAKVSLNEQAFNIYHSLKASAQFDEFYKRTNSRDRINLIWRQVVGWTQRFFSACWAQATAQGVFRIFKKNKKLRRAFKFHNNNVSIFPVLDGSGVGFDYAVGAGGGVLRGGVVAIGRAMINVSKDYLWQKQQVLQTYFKPTTGRETLCNLLK